MADYLPSFIDQANPGYPQSAHDDNVAVIVATVRRRTSSEAGIGRLHNDDFVRRDTGLEHFPLLDKVAGPNYGQDWSISKSEAPAVAERAAGFGQHVARTDD